MKSIRRTRLKLGIHLVGAMFLAYPCSIVGLLLCLTLIGIPFGFAVMWFGCLPTVHVCSKWLKLEREWSFRDQPMPSEFAETWPMTGSIVIPEAPQD